MTFRPSLQPRQTSTHPPFHQTVLLSNLTFRREASPPDCLHALIDPRTITAITRIDASLLPMGSLVEIIVQPFQRSSILCRQILSSAKQQDLSGQKLVEAGRICLVFLVELLEAWEREQQAGVVDVGQVPPSVFGTVLEFPEVCLLGGEFAPDLIARWVPVEIAQSVDGPVSERKSDGLAQGT